VLAVLDDPGVVDHPGSDADLGRHPLGARPDQQLRIPGRIGQKLLHRLVPRRRLLQPKQRRLQALPAAMLDQPPHIQKRVLPLTHMRQQSDHLPDKGGQTLPRLRRRHHWSKRCFHLSSSNDDR
jgi:hypothetical protein